MEIKDLTLQEILDIDKGLGFLKEKKDNEGTKKGVSMPVTLMYRNGKTEGQIKSRVINWEKTKDAKLKDLSVLKETGELDANGNIALEPDGDPKKEYWLSKKNKEVAEKELQAELDNVDKDLVLRGYLLSEFLDLEKDSYYKKLNANSPIPQEFFSLMGKMIEDDTDKKRTKSKK